MIQSASCFHLFGPRTLRLLSFCTAEHTTALQKVAFPSFWPLHSSSCCRSAKSSVPLRFRKSCFHLSERCTLRLLSFRKVEHTIAFQKVSIFLAAARFAASHGSWVVSRRSHQRRQCLDSAYILSYAGGENITREPNLKSVSKHFVLH